MNKKVIIFLSVIFLAYLVFRPKYSGYGQKCECIGYKQDRVNKTHLNIVDPETFEPLIKGTETVTTICYGIPHQCELNAGYEILNPKN